MSENNQKTIDILQDLLTRAYDAEQGFNHAAEAVEHDALASLFREYSDQRRAFGGEIKSVLVSLGAEPDKGASMIGKLHQFWIDLRGKLSDSPEHEILDECLRGEDKTIEDYREYARASDVTPAANRVITNQLMEIEKIHKRLKSLENAASAMSS